MSRFQNVLFNNQNLRFYLYETTIMETNVRTQVHAANIQSSNFFSFTNLLAWAIATGDISSKYVSKTIFSVKFYGKKFKTSTFHTLPFSSFSAMNFSKKLTNLEDHIYTSFRDHTLKAHDLKMAAIPLLPAGLNDVFNGCNTRPYFYLIW